MTRLLREATQGALEPISLVGGVFRAAGPLRNARDACREAGCEGPLYPCSFYGNRAAGAKLEKMLQMGQSRPWPEALEAMTGEREMDASAMYEYFEPLKSWLDEQNAGRKVGF